MEVIYFFIQYLIHRICIMERMKKPILKLVDDEQDKEILENYLGSDNNKISKRIDSKSGFVMQMQAFCDELDRQIEEIMQM